MKRGLYVVSVLAMTYAPLSGQTDTLRIRFVGNAAFVLNDGHTTLVTDLPYQSGAFGYMAYETSALPTGQVTAVVTHGHADHFDRELFRRTGWNVIGPSAVVGDAATPLRMEDGRWEVGDFAITAHETPHSDDGHHSYLIEWRSRRLFFTGDTEDTTQLVTMKDLDIAFVTPWLLCAVRESNLALSATRIVLHHQFPDQRSRVCGDPVVLAQGQILHLAAR